MYENMTFENIMERALKQVVSDVDKRQGSIIWDAIAPACAEIAQMYIEIDNILNLTYAETSYGEWLDKRCREMGVHRESATYAVRLGVMTGSNKTLMNIPIGSRFSMETVNYIATERIETGKYKLACEQSGCIGNQLFGKLIPIENITGLVSAELSDVLIPGEEDETDESLYARYVEKVNSTPYGGNIDDYKQKVNAIDGVADCKVFPAWNGGGTVKVTVIDARHNTPSSTLIESIQEILDPVPFSQNGQGLAPIGHLVTVTPVESVTVDFFARLILKQGLEIGGLQTDIEEVLSEYLLSLSMQWSKEEYLIVRINQLEARILSIDGILDIENTLLNGNAGNIILESEQIPVMGTVILND